MSAEPVSDPGLAEKQMQPPSVTPKWVDGLLVDAHVHLHPGWPLEKLIDRAAENFAAVRARHSGVNASAGGLMLTESSGVDRFGEIADGHGVDLGGWRVHLTAEARSLWLTCDRAAPLLVVAGRQVVTDERLEVLALGTNHSITDGMALEETVEHVLAADALPVLPWGVGKWWGRRGALVRDVLKRFDQKQLVLADNAGRPVGWPMPGTLRVARRAGRGVLAGSDPLPVQEGAWRAGSFGHWLPGRIDEAEPARAVIEQLRDGASRLETFGRRVSWPGFIREQMALRRLS